MSKRKLADLFVTGAKVYLNDGDKEDPSNEVAVWVQKINQFEHDQCVRKANAAKALVLAKRNLLDDDPDRAEYQLTAESIAVQREHMINLMVKQDIEQMRPAREDEIAAEDEWAEDSYLEGLREAWEDGLRDEWVIDPEECSQEAKDVYESMKKFLDQVEKKLENEERILRRDYEELDDEKLGREMTNRLISLDADAAWLDSYTKWRLVFAVRDVADRDEQLLDDVDDLNALQPQTINLLREEYNKLSVDLLEGKD